MENRGKNGNRQTCDHDSSAHAAPFHSNCVRQTHRRTDGLIPNTLRAACGAFGVVVPLLSAFYAAGRSPSYETDDCWPRRRREGDCVVADSRGRPRREGSTLDCSHEPNIWTSKWASKSQITNKPICALKMYELRRTAEMSQQNTRNVTTTPRVSRSMQLWRGGPGSKSCASANGLVLSVDWLPAPWTRTSRKSEVSVSATRQYFEIFKRIKTLRGRHNTYRRMSSSKPSPSTASGIQCASNSSAAIA